MREVVQGHVSTTLFSFQDLKLNTRDIFVILKDTLNTTSSSLLIPDPHATEVPSNTLERHMIGSCVVDGIHNLIISSSDVLPSPWLVPTWDQLAQVVELGMTHSQFLKGLKCKPK
jgi:hypothetical protein